MRAPRQPEGGKGKMNDIVFSSWGGRVVDNRGKAADAFAPAEHVDLPEHFGKDEEIRALIGWGGIVLRSDDGRRRRSVPGLHDGCQRKFLRQVHPLPNRYRGDGRHPETDLRGRRGARGSRDAGDPGQTVIETAKCSIGQSGPVALLHALDAFQGRLFARPLAGTRAAGGGQPTAPRSAHRAWMPARFISTSPATWS